jgi:hypothetical protein
VYAGYTAYTLENNSRLSREASEAVYFDVTGNAMPDSKPVGSINRARWRAEVACREARMSKTGDAGRIESPIASMRAFFVEEAMSRKEGS